MPNNCIFIKFFFSMLITKIQNHLQKIIASCLFLVSFVNNLVYNCSKLSIDGFGNKTKNENSFSACSLIVIISEYSRNFKKRIHPWHKKHNLLFHASPKSGFEDFISHSAEIGIRISKRLTV